MEIGRLLARWTLVHAVVMIGITFLSLYLQTGVLLAVIALISFLTLIATHWPHWRVLGWHGGAANIITSIRLLILGSLLILHPSLGKWEMAVIATIALLLDILDGYVARRFKLATPLGAAYDKEVDAFGFLALSLCLVLSEVPIWVLMIGLLRYGYVLLMQFFRPPQGQEQRFKWGVIIAIIVMVCLPIAFVLPPLEQQAILAFSLCLLIFSFGRSFFFVLKG